MVAVKKLLWRGLRGASYNLGVDSRRVCGVWMVRRGCGEKKLKEENSKMKTISILVRLI